MMSLAVVMSNRRFAVFHGEQPDTFCLVPEDLLDSSENGPNLFRGKFIEGGWAVGNLRANRYGIGGMVFPDLKRPIKHPNTEINAFVSRFRQEIPVNLITTPKP